MTKRDDIIWLDKIDSTNEYVRSRIQKLDNLSVVAAKEQMEGRGQGKNTWHSEPGKNLLFSIILKDTCLTASEQKIISDIAAASVKELLFNHGIEAWIKPPNDIWVRDKKICGILIEHSLRGNRILHSIIGIGLNVNQTSFPSELPNPTSMAIEGCTKDCAELLSEFLDIFVSHASLL